MSEWDDPRFRDRARQLAKVMYREYECWVDGLEELDERTAMALKRGAEWVWMKIENEEGEQ